MDNGSRSSGSTYGNGIDDGGGSSGSAYGNGVDDGGRSSGNGTDSFDLTMVLRTGDDTNLFQPRLGRTADSVGFIVLRASEKPRCVAGSMDKSANGVNKLSKSVTGKGRSWGGRESLPLERNKEVFCRVKSVLSCREKKCLVLSEKELSCLKKKCPVLSKKRPVVSRKRLSCLVGKDCPVASGKELSCLVGKEVSCRKKCLVLSKKRPVLSEGELSCRSSS